MSPAQGPYVPYRRGECLGTFLRQIVAGVRDLKVQAGAGEVVSG